MLKRGNFAEGFVRFGNLIIAPILRVTLTFIDIQVGFNAGAAQLAVRAHGVAQEQVIVPLVRRLLYVL